VKYRINKTINQLKENEQITDGGASFIEIINREDYERDHNNKRHERYLLKSMDRYQYCKADLLRDCTIGTFVIPDKTFPMDKELCFGYYLNQTQLIFVDDTGTVEHIASEIEKNQIVDDFNIAYFLFEFLEYLVKDDVQYLQDYEKRMTDLEEELFGGVKNKVPQLILKIRKELLHINGYYKQLMNMSETLAENYNQLLQEEDCNLFKLFSDRVSRLSEDTQILRESALQVLEMYQTQVDVRQNEIMRLLTGVTTLFMPLTLITGWYGMNFAHMPELGSRFGYLIIILVSFIIAVGEFCFFKRKKWF
jgi:magnesium transporter